MWRKVKPKKYLADPLLLFMGAIPYIPCVPLCIIAFIKFVNDLQLYRALLVLLVLAVCSLLIPLSIIPGTATLCFHEDYFVCKKNIFSKKKMLPYAEISKLYLDFGWKPPTDYFRYKELKSSQRGYIYSHGEIVCFFEIRYNLLNEWLKHIDKNRLKINIDEDFYKMKKYLSLLQDCLSLKQKEKLDKAIAKKHSQHKKSQQ